MRARSTASGLSDIDNSPRAMRLGKNIAVARCEAGADLRRESTLDGQRRQQSVVVRARLTPTSPGSHTAFWLRRPLENHV